MTRLLLLFLAVAMAVDASAQPQASGTPLRLADLHEAAAASDPRAGELTLLESQSALRRRNLQVQWLPFATVESQAQHQSDAPTSPLLAPSGRPAFAAPKTTYDTSARVDQRLFDPAVGAQIAVEGAQLSEAQARVRTAVYAVRQQVDEAFFAAATLQQRARVLDATIAELTGRLQEANARVDQGMALPADAAAIEATLLQRQQDQDELNASLRAALARLSTIVGRPIPADAVPVIPDLAAQTAEVRDRVRTARLRPEYEQFDRTRERIARQQDLGGAQALPKLSAFGRVGYGRPGLDFIQDEWQPYGIAGLRLQWTAWNWGTTKREQEAQALQAQIVAAEESAFTRGLAQAADTELAAIDHLMRALTTDRRIIELREEVERAARVRLEEGVLTSSDYLARETELLQARIAQATHEVELAHAQARLLTTVGAEVR